MNATTKNQNFDPKNKINPVNKGKIACIVRNKVQMSLSDKPVLRIKCSALSTNCFLISLNIVNQAYIILTLLSRLYKLKFCLYKLTIRDILQRNFQILI